MTETFLSKHPVRSWSRSRWLRNGLLLPLWVLNGWVLLRLISFLQPFLTIFVLALVLAMLLDVPVRRLQRRGMGRGPALLLVLVAVLLGGTVALALLLPALLGQAGQLLAALPTWLESSQGVLGKVLAAPWIPADGAAGETMLRGLSGELTSVARELLGSLPSLLSAGMGAGLMIFLTVILTVFLLLGGGSAWAGLLRWLPPWWRVRIQAELPARLGIFLQGQVAIATGFALLLALVFSLIRVPFGALLGIIIGLASLVPFMGAVAQVGVSVFLVVHDAAMGVAVFAIAFVLGQIVDNVVVPRVMGNLVGLNPLWLLLTVFLGAKVAGIPGILVSVPLASTISVIANDWMDGQERSSVPQQDAVTDLGPSF